MTTSYQQKLAECQAIDAERQRRREQYESRQLDNEFNAIMWQIDRAFERSRLVDSQLTINIRLKHVPQKYYNETLKNSLNFMFASKGIVITHVYGLSNGNGAPRDDFGECMCSAVLCCIPVLFYWLPKFAIDALYGEMYTLTFRFVSCA